MKENYVVWCVLMLMGSLVTGLRADDPAVHTVQAGPFHKVLKASGQCEPMESTELRTQFKHFTTLRVERVLPDGAVVAAGEPVLWFERREYDRQLSLKEMERSVAAIAREIARLEFERDRVVQQLELDQLSTQLEHLIADRTHYLDVEFPRQVESTRKGLEWSGEYLEDQREELRQLLRMYEEDELIEESEELVLRRMRRSLAQSEYHAENSRQSTLRQLEEIFPREFKSRERTFIIEQERLRTQISVVEATRQRRALEWQKSEREFEFAQADLAELRAEGERLMLVAPRDGIFVHGETERGKLGGARRWKVGDTLGGDVVVGMVYDPQGIRLRIDLPEEFADLVRPGMEARAAAKAFPQRWLAARVIEIGRHPLASGHYDAVLELNESSAMRAAMKVDAVLTAYVNPNALTVPAKAVFTDEVTQERYVFVQREEGPQRCAVVAGLSSDEVTEVTAGLRAGERVLLEKPK